MKYKCSHILLSHIDAEASNNTRSLGEAFAEAERLIKEIKQGKISFQDCASKNSHCASGPRNGGDLGWKNDFEMPPDFERAVKSIPIGDIGEPFVTDFGVHIVLRTG